MNISRYATTGSMIFALTAAAAMAQDANFGAGNGNAADTQPGDVSVTSTIAQYQPGGVVYGGSNSASGSYDMMAPAAGPTSASSSLAPVPAPAYSRTPSGNDGSTYTTSTSGMTTRYAEPHPLDEQAQNPAASPYAASTLPLTQPYQTMTGQPYAQPQPFAQAPAPIWQAPSPTTPDGMAQAEPSAPAPTAQNDSLYITGGVTKDERDNFATLARNYNLKLSFSNPSGELVSDVNVQVSDSKGSPVLSTVTDGPILMAKLNPGKYKIETSKDGETKTQNVEVGKSGMKSLTIIWKNV